jgi:SET domain-containing protein
MLKFIMKKKQSSVLKKGGTISKVTAKKIRKKVGTENSGKKLPDHHFKKVKVKRGLDGLGLFAEEPIKKGELVIEYIGNILNKEEADAVKGGMYLFEVNRNKTIDGSVRWNIARYCNHSCDGNAESEIKKGRVFIKATKTIKEGEEIVYDYGEEFVKEFIAPKGCRCVAKKHSYGAKGFVSNERKEMSIESEVAESVSEER